MNKSFLYTLVLLCFLSCKKENLGDCFKSTGDKTIETRAVETFSKLKLHDNINLFLTQSPTNKMEIEAGENIVKHVETSFSDGTLEIKNNNKCNWVRSFKRKINVYLSCPNLTEITYYGSGEILFVNEFQLQEFKLNMWESSGNISLKIRANKVELKSHTGPGDIYCEGEVDEFVAYLNGVGRIDCRNFVAQNGLCVNRNVGNVKVNVQNSLKADISGDGNIEYTGSPTIELIRSGRGNLIQQH